MNLVIHDVNYAKDYLFKSKVDIIYNNTDTCNCSKKKQQFSIKSHVQNGDNNGNTGANLSCKSNCI
jgi:hypothetical protein